MKMGRRLRCSSVTNRFRLRPPRAVPAAHFERNDVIIICETVHKVIDRCNLVAVPPS